MKELIGKKIDSVLFDFEGQEFIKFVCEDGESFTYYTDGDCCSSSYFTDINGVQALLGHTVNSLEEIVMPTLATPYVRECDKEGDVVCAYGYKMRTTGGYVDFVFHNDSNGYYGGSLDLYTGVKPIAWAPLTEDYSA